MFNTLLTAALECHFSPFHLHLFILGGEGNGNPVQYSCLKNFMDRGAWPAVVHGITGGWTRLCDCHSLHLLGRLYCSPGALASSLLTHMMFFLYISLSSICCSWIHSYLVLLSPPSVVLLVIQSFPQYCILWITQYKIETLKSFLI